MRRGNRVARLEPRERRQDVVQQLRQHVGQRGAEQVDAQAVEQVRDRAEEVAEEIAGAWDRRDVEDHFIEWTVSPSRFRSRGPNATAARKGRATRLNASILDLRFWSTTLPSALAVRHLAGTPASPANGAARHGR